MITVARLTALANVISARRYLEIGVSAGATFLKLNFPYQTAVDPAFKFKPAAHRRAGWHFLQKTSDKFFSAPPSSALYDLIFIDGLHTFEQTFRDFCACQALTHGGSIFLIDDTLPSDSYSAIPDQDRALTLRRLEGGKGGAWHGDVFKVVFALHDFFPNFDYRTIVGNGNPQTVVIRKPRRDFAPRWNDLAVISKMGYTDFLANRDLLKECSEAEMMRWLKAAKLPPSPGEGAT